MSKPLTPSQVIETVRKNKLNNIPDDIVEVYNELIVKYWDGTGATIPKQEVISEIMKKYKLETSQTIFDEGWLNIELLFQPYGWNIKSHNGVYHDSTFEFRVR